MESTSLCHQQQRHMKLSKLLPVKTRRSNTHSSTEARKPVSPGPFKEARSASTTRKTYELPTYLAQELRIRAAAEGVTERYLLLRALKQAGFDVCDRDLVVDRRSGGKSCNR